ncbi:TPA: dUTP pyrophosphatase, partial [Staphylococcus pseudintermedius]|nr:dUTP pyrophosphatase [Staphylococcus pseudintermedius]
KIDAGFHGNMKINIKNDYVYEDPYDDLFCHADRIYSGVYGVDGRIIDNDLYKDFPVYQINKGDRLAQLVIVPIITPELEQVEEFTSESARGEKGFGSSGF